ncbi:MAG: hypothetical protein AAFX08_05570 [Pseudomonadota bacterium]
MKFTLRNKLAASGGLIMIAGAGCAHIDTPKNGTSVRPEVIAFGSEIEEIRTRLEGECGGISLREVDIPLPGAARKEQIDCEGFSYFGAPRKAEFVFGDGRLMLVWILTDRSDLDGMVDAFTAEFGAPTHVSDVVVAFVDDNAAIRYDTPEAGFYAPELSDQYRAFFDQMMQRPAK